MAGRRWKMVLIIVVYGMASFKEVTWMSQTQFIYITGRRTDQDQLSDAELRPEGASDKSTQAIKDDTGSDDVTAVSRDTLVCTPDVRMERHSEVCISMDPGDRPVEPIQWATFDNVHKAVWILVPKAGSRSWLDYFARSVNRTEPVTMNRQMYREIGINFTNLAIPEEVNSLYKDYFKFTVVRHPLQRFVSAYFEVMVKVKKFDDRCNKIRKRLEQSYNISCQKEPKFSFSDFAMAFAQGLLPGNEHWRSQQIAVQPCTVDLDLIVKSETGEYDTLLVNNRLGIIPDHKVDRLHLGTGHVAEDHASESDRLIADLTRYDTILFDLQEQHPETFKWVLDYYAIDMEMFGYTWDVESGSGCGYKQHQCC